MIPRNKPRDAPLSTNWGQYCGWTKCVRTTLKPRETIVCLVFTRESSIQGFLGGANWISSIHSIKQDTLLSTTSGVGRRSPNLPRHVGWQTLRDAFLLLQHRAAREHQIETQAEHMFSSFRLRIFWFFTTVFVQGTLANGAFLVASQWNFL